MVKRFKKFKILPKRKKKKEVFVKLDETGVGQLTTIPKKRSKMFPMKLRSAY